MKSEQLQNPGLKIQEGKMRKKEIRAIATNHGIKGSKLRKWEIIRAIQRAEGNLDCFRTFVADNCDQTACLWRNGCIGKKKKGT